MGRSVVLAGAARCPRCSLPPRWCTCDMLPPVETRLAVHVLIHWQESWKPSSTGRLVARVVSGAATHVYQRTTKFFPAATVPADRLGPEGELWILHPNGDLPSVAAGEGTASSTIRRHVLLLDGTWRQAGEMLRTIEGMGRCIRLPDASDEPSRNWLRDQAEPERISTAEALMGVFRAMGDLGAERILRLHFELHVYATLLARGRREMAERYLGHSPLLSDALGALEQLHARKTSSSPAAQYRAKPSFGESATMPAQTFLPGPTPNTVRSHTGQILPVPHGWERHEHVRADE